MWYGLFWSQCTNVAAKITRGNVEHEARLLNRMALIEQFAVSISARNAATIEHRYRGCRDVFSGDIEARLWMLNIDSQNRKSVCAFAQKSVRIDEGINEPRCRK